MLDNSRPKEFFLEKQEDIKKIVTKIVGNEIVDYTHLIYFSRISVLT